MDELELRVGDKVTLETPEGRIATFTVIQVTADQGIGEAWTSTTPHSGRVMLRLREEEARTGTWAQDVEGKPTVWRPGDVVHPVRDLYA